MTPRRFLAAKRHEDAGEIGGQIAQVFVKVERLIGDAINVVVVATGKQRHAKFQHLPQCDLARDRHGLREKFGRQHLGPVRRGLAVARWMRLKVLYLSDVKSVNTDAAVPRDSVGNSAMSSGLDLFCVSRMMRASALRPTGLAEWRTTRDARPGLRSCAAHASAPPAIDPVQHCHRRIGGTSHVGV